MMYWTAALAAIMIVSLAVGLVFAARSRRITQSNSENIGRGEQYGACGDLFQLQLQFQNDRVVHSTFRTAGCAHGMMCLHAAADLARGQQAQKVLEITADDIARKAGGIPADHAESAHMAVRVLHAAATDYQDRHPNARLGRMDFKADP